MKKILITLSLLIATLVNSGVLSHLDDAIKAIKGSVHVAEEIPKPIKKGTEETLQNAPQKSGQKNNTELNAYITVQVNKMLNQCMVKTKEDKEKQEICSIKTKAFESCLKSANNNDRDLEKSMEICKKQHNL